MMVTSARRVGRYYKAWLARGDKTMLRFLASAIRTIFGSGVRHAGYCVSAPCADRPRNRVARPPSMLTRNQARRVPRSPARLSRLGFLIPLAAKCTSRKLRGRSVI